MEVKAGYKQTEVGVIPEDWEVDFIQNHSNINTGSKNTQDKVEGGKYPFFVRSQTIERLNSYSFEGEAVLTAGDGVGTGKVFHYINGKFDYHQRVYKMSHFSSKLNGFFFYQYFKNSFYSRIRQMTAKSSVDSVRREMIANMAIPLPPVNEQAEIATALSDMEALIENLKKLSAKKRLIKKGAMQELLRPKEGWKRKKLGDVLKVRHGKSQKGIIDKNGKYPILATGGKIGNSNYFLCNRPSVLIGRKGTIDAPQYMETPFWTVDTLFYTDIIEGYDAKFIFYMFCLIDWYSHNEASGVPSLNAKTIELLEKHFPQEKKEQVSISQILSNMDTEILQLEAQLAKYKQIKAGMMQELLTGKRRLV